MIKALYRSMAIIRFALERLVHHPGLTILALSGVVLAVGLVSNASFFAQAVDQVILNQELAEFSRMTGRPPFSTSIYAFPSTQSVVTVDVGEDLAQNVSATLANEVGLPVDSVTMQLHSGNMMLQPREGSAQYSEGETFLGAVDIAYLEKVADAMTIVAGDPMDPDSTSGEVVDIWMHTRLAEKMGMNAGDELEIGINVQADTIPIRVAGIWQATDPESDYWFENPDATLQNALLIRRSDYVNRIQPMVASGSWYVAWHVILNGDEIYPELAQEYLQGFTRAEVIINRYLPKTKINTPPLDPLKSFVTRGDTLSVILLSFNLPAFGFLLYFLVLSSTIISQWQQRETATLVGRGMRPSSILTLTFFEELVLFAVGYPLGIGLGMLLARVMGNTSSFLAFTSRPPLPVALRGLNVPFTLIALLVAMLARVIPAGRATRLSALEVDRAHARLSKGPLWYRAYLDFLLIIPTFYAYRQITQKGSLSALVETSPADIYQDPLMILVPALFMLTASLMVLRLFPIIMRGLDFVATLVPWATPHLALRQLARRSHTYINPLLLVITSLALGVYTLSMAASLDQWLVDRIYYGVGSDMSIGVYPLGDNSGEGVTVITGEWIPQPANFEDVEGIQAATRVGIYPASSNMMVTEDFRGDFMAIDRLTFPRVAWFRNDFATVSLGALMNQLATSSNSVLMSRELFEANDYFIGDTINLSIAINYEFHVADQFTIVGTFDYFPTVYEEERPALIGNLEHLNFYVGMPIPHGLWLRLDPGADAKDVLKAIPTTLRIGVSDKGDALNDIREEQGRFERVGVFGTLSVGFIAAVVMAVMGLLIYTYASLRERLERFTILRAVGMLRSQITAQVVMEYAFLTLYGSVGGAIIGSYASRLFVPLFRITGEEGVPLPPLIPIIAEDQVRFLIGVFVSIIIGLEVLVISRALSKRAFSLLKGVFG